MHQPLINIFVPTYEPQARHLKEAIESILAQTEKRWTLLIHDDASTVDVNEIIKPYLADPRIRFERSDGRLGIGGNWNACLEQAVAPFVQFLFQDDVWTPTYLERSIAILERDEGIGFTAANHTYRTDDGKPAGDHYEYVRHKREEVLKSGRYDGREFLMQWVREGLHPNLIGEPSFVMMRREMIERTGLFSHDLPQCLDLEYWTRLLINTHWQYIPEELGFFRVHPQAASAVNQQSGAGIFDRLVCLKRLQSSLNNPAEKKIVRDSIRRSIDDMVRKFFTRRKDRMPGASGGLRKIPLSYYPLIMKGILRYWMNKRVR